MEYPPVTGGWTERLARLRPVAGPFLAYAGASVLARTLLSTIVSYIVSLSDKTGMEFSNTVNEIASQYTLLALALGALLLCLTLSQADRALYRHLPFWNEAQRPLWRLDRSRKEELLRGLSNGLLAALACLVLLTATGQVSYLGVYITSMIGTPIFPLFFVDILALVALVACEEFLFRHKILRSLLAHLPVPLAVACAGGLHLLVRHWQFPLGAFDYANLFCLNLALGYFFVKSGKCHRGLGLVASLLFLLHSLAGLPLWGTESPSFFLFRVAPNTSAFLSGGASGPLAGSGLFGILAFLAAASYLAWKREREVRGPAERQAPLAR